MESRGQGAREEERWRYRGIIFTYVIRMVVTCTDTKQFEICPVELPEDYKHTSKRVSTHSSLYLVLFPFIQLIITQL